MASGQEGVDIWLTAGMMDLESNTEFKASYSNYALLPEEAKGDRRKMASRGRKEAQELHPFSDTDLSQRLAKIDTDVLNRIKIFLASESPNGENFSISLKQIKDVLERSN